MISRKCSVWIFNSQIMKTIELKRIFGVLTVFFTVSTAVLLLLAIWEVLSPEEMIFPQLIGTSITFAAFSFVLFIVTSFWKK